MNRKRLIFVVLVIVGIGLLVYRLTSANRTKKINKTEITAKPTVISVSKSESKIGIMADIHNDTESLNKALTDAKNRGLKLMVIAGDLTINGTEKEMEVVKKTLDTSNLNYLAVPGNHDDYKQVWIFGPKYQSYKVNGAKLILIDNSNWRGLGEAQKKWIVNEIGECRVIKCLAVMHMPLNNLLSKHIMGEYNESTAEEAKWLRSILVQNNVLTGYSGHLHYSSSYTYEGWETVLVGAISEDRNNQTPRYTEVEIVEDSRGEVVGVNNEVNVLLE